MANTKEIVEKILSLHERAKRTDFPEEAKTCMRASQRLQDRYHISQEQIEWFDRTEMDFAASTSYEWLVLQGLAEKFQGLTVSNLCFRGVRVSGSCEVVNEYKTKSEEMLRQLQTYTLGMVAYIFVKKIVPNFYPHTAPNEYNPYDDQEPDFTLLALPEPVIQDYPEEPSPETHSDEIPPQPQSQYIPEEIKRFMEGDPEMIRVRDQVSRGESQGMSWTSSFSFFG